jgi:hypothetical protein
MSKAIVNTAADSGLRATPATKHAAVTSVSSRHTAGSQGRRAQRTTSSSCSEIVIDFADPGSITVRFLAKDPASRRTWAARPSLKSTALSCLVFRRKIPPG